jgi:hypothetical protein
MHNSKVISLKKVYFVQTANTNYHGLVQLEIATTYAWSELDTMTGSRTSMQNTISITNNTWVYYAWTLRNGTISIYINGTLLGSQSGMITPPAVTRSPCYLGYRYDQATDLSGFDEIRIYNRSLNATEILNDYKSASFVGFL